jgi:hypothetical protein
MNLYRFLADATLIVHAAFVAVVVVGLLMVLVGILRRWRWIRNFWFRAIHLAMIGVVVIQSLLGIVCPLTTLESYLRMKGGGQPYPDAFITYWVHELLFCVAPTWAFTVTYCLFGAAVLATWLVAPPRWPWRRDEGAVGGKRAAK